jgi:Transposase DDE domain/Transposase domain (DUF772)
MQLNPRQLVTQFAHLLQLDIFPALETVTGPISEAMQLVAAVVPLLPLQRSLDARRSRTGRPARDRAAMATAFIAKAVLNLATTRDLIERLKVDDSLRRLCGWNSASALPHESKFSRAFAEFAATELPQQLHAALVEATQRERLIGHVARDSTAIPARERFPESQRADKKKKKASKTRRAKGSFAKAKAAERGTRIERQRKQKLPQMLSDLPRQCDIGVKKTSQGHEQYWRGYKLHLDVADGQIPISAILTSASVHDSQVAIPLMTMTGQRVTHLYELMDSAYDADLIHEHSKQLQHVPIIAPHPRRGTKQPSQLPKIFPEKPAPEMSPAQQERYKERTMSERVNARLKDEFGASKIRVRGAAKIMAHLMFGVIALTVDQWLRLAAPG